MNLRIPNFLWIFNAENGGDNMTMLATATEMTLEDFRGVGENNRNTLRLSAVSTT